MKLSYESLMYPKPLTMTGMKVFKNNLYGITELVFNIIKSFSTKRKTQVVLKGQTSKQYYINAGMP